MTLPYLGEPAAILCTMLAGLLLFFLACTGEASPIDSAAADTIDPLSWPIDQVGPYSVGFRSASLTYESASGDGPRIIGINLWYPTHDDGGSAAVYFGLYEDDAVFDGATPASSAYPGGRAPVLVHSHGSMAYGGASPSLMRYFASHGWIAIAPDHTNNTLTDITVQRAVEHYFERSFDVSAVLDSLQTLPQDDPLAGVADTDAVVMSGHSRGGYTTWASAGAGFSRGALEDACAGDSFAGGCDESDYAIFAAGLRDERIAAAIPMAGGNSSWFGADGHAQVQIPMLQMSGAEDNDGAPDVWEKAQGVPLTWVQIAGGCHDLFSFGSCAQVEGEEGFAIINHYALAFARAHILGDTSEATQAVLDGSQAVSERVTLQQR